MENETQYFVMPEELLNGILTNLSEQKLKDGLNLYVSLQQNVKPLDQFLASQGDETPPPASEK